VTVSTSSGTERIARAFARARAERRLAAIVYLTVGYPERSATGALLRAALDGGADIIEVGVPFSDPLADGATVQRASETALAQGIGLADCLREAESLIRERDATTVLFGYTNPFLHHPGGLDAFARDAARAGVAGVIVPDLPAEEAGEFDAALGPEGLARIDLYAPTTPDDRLARLVPAARGFVYCVSLTGVTGARPALASDVREFVSRVRRHTTLPIAVGFGISAPEHVAALRGVADAFVVGSAALDAVAAAPAARRADALRGFVATLVAAGKS
jgi:tryptophan synthase alpha chain